MSLACTLRPRKAYEDAPYVTVRCDFAAWPASEGTRVVVQLL